MATNIYLKIETPDIKGESTDSGHKEQIEILSWSHGVSQTTSPTRSTAGSGTVERANHQDLTFSKYADISSTDLIKSCWAGTHHNKVTIAQFRSAGNAGADVEFLSIELEDVVISSYSIGAGSGDLPIETISLAYGKVTYKYDPADEKTGKSAGSKPVSHDLKTNVVA
jgi:type VI secretion system secreted protein Hcp